jgi:hypothetical protein
MASKGYTYKQGVCGGTSKGVCGGTSIKSVSDVRASFLPGISKKNIRRGIPEKITAFWDAII